MRREIVCILKDKNFGIVFTITFVKDIDYNQRMVKKFEKGYEALKGKIFTSKKHLIDEGYQLKIAQNEGQVIKEEEVLCDTDKESYTSNHDVTTASSSGKLQTNNCKNALKEDHTGNFSRCMLHRVHTHPLLPSEVRIFERENKRMKEEETYFNRTLFRVLP
ncbi:hypothetical protein EGR_09020 [Echinococcus granulosus]|uniref:Uncharacterized protein n=1 Tax=Echinococcus granulosus TaxID=6210 RepID=W6U4Q9_ECHGR|nr:hypothetical protein EGR_09020 [Echinococcus granulosus]EUB56128.1 hypothetical protein EGR_09020 [Echinococcus granulosus]